MIREKYMDTFLSSQFIEPDKQLILGGGHIKFSVLKIKNVKFDFDDDLGDCANVSLSFKTFIVFPIESMTARLKKTIKYESLLPQLILSFLFESSALEELFNNSFYDALKEGDWDVSLDDTKMKLKKWNIDKLQDGIKFSTSGTIKYFCCKDQYLGVYEEEYEDLEDDDDDY